MKMYSTVEAAVTIATKMFDANYVTYDTNSLRRRIYNWYSHTDVTDAEMLAACALEGMDWHLGATYEDMMMAKEEWFPTTEDCFSTDNIAIWDIEYAQAEAVMAY